MIKGIYFGKAARSLPNWGLAVARTWCVRSNTNRHFPRFDPMFHGLHANHRPTPSAVAMRIKPVCVSYFQVPVCACARGSKGAPALRASEEKDMGKTFSYGLHVAPQV